MGLTLIIAALASGCDSGDCQDGACETGAAARCDIAVNSLTQMEVLNSPQVHDLTVSLTGSAGLAVTCSLADQEAEKHLYESASAPEHDLLLAGLLPESIYQCQATPVCSDVLGESRAFQVETGQRIGAFPTVEVEGEPDNAFVLVNHAQFCNGAQPLRLLVFDAAGRIRWSYGSIPDDVSVSIGNQYLGDGVFFWGGGESQDGDAQYVDLRQDTRYQIAFDGSDELSWHHEARVYSNGQVLTMNQSVNGDGHTEWRGFQLTLFDPQTETVTWSWSSQSGVDQGVLGPGSGDVYHANWAGVDQDARRAYASLCSLEQVISIDMDSGEILWTFGKDGDFALVDESGAALRDADFPQCQHGVEIAGDTLLFYDNGGGRVESRITEYTLDFATRTATRNWTWTEPAFYEPALGDVDYLDDGTVLVGRGHVECVGGVPGEVSQVLKLDPRTGEIPWRMRFTNDQDTIYRASLIDPCDVFGHAGYCPQVAERITSLGL
jgi:hypothetical protein